MLNTIQRMFSGSRLEGPESALLRIDVPFDGQITAVQINIDGTINSGTTIFNVRLNGTPLWTGGDRPSMTGSTKIATKDGLSVVVQKNDILLLDIISVAGGHFITTVGWRLSIEDGITVPPGGTTGQGLVKTSNANYATGWGDVGGGGGPGYTPQPTSVEDEAARFALTDLAVGDLVVQEDIERTFVVIDSDELDNPAGYLLIARYDDQSGGGGGSGPDVQMFETPGSADWTNPSPSSARLVKVIAIGGGGGAGGGGRSDNTGINGGSGGGGGAYAEATFISNELGSTEAVVVGAGGAGGAARSTTGTGNSGTVGGNSSFGGTKLVAGGGGFGAGGGTTQIMGGGGGGSARGSNTNLQGQATGSTTQHYGGAFLQVGTAVLDSFGPAGGNSTSSGQGIAWGTGGGAGGRQGTPSAGGKAMLGGGGGGYGGTANRGGATAAAGAAGGASGFASENYNSGTRDGGGGAAGASGGTGGSAAAGTAGADAVGIQGGAGGGGGGGTASITDGHVGGNGGDGGLYGGGGGGGGGKSATTGTGDTGKGGDGADGVVVVITY